MSTVTSIDRRKGRRSPIKPVPEMDVGHIPTDKVYWVNLDYNGYTLIHPIPIVADRQAINRLTEASSSGLEVRVRPDRTGILICEPGNHPKRLRPWVSDVLYGHDEDEQKSRRKRHSQFNYHVMDYRSKNYSCLDINYSRPIPTPPKKKEAPKDILTNVRPKPKIGEIELTIDGMVVRGAPEELAAFVKAMK